MMIHPFGGLRIFVKTADEQRRTPLYRTDIWIRPGRVPSKHAGRKGTRRAWKRLHQPHWLWAHEEPSDVLQLGDMLIVTPRQNYALRRASQKVSPNEQ